MPIIFYRDTKPNDSGQLDELYELAFSTARERTLVDQLQSTKQLELCAQIDDSLVAHLLCSQVHLPKQPNVKAAMLCPVAVRPLYRGHHIGTVLMRSAFDELRNQGVSLLLTIFAVPYFERFGFVSATKFGLTAPQPAPRWDQQLLAKWLLKDQQQPLSGSPQLATPLLDL